MVFPHFKNTGFGKSAGFLDDPEGVDVSICFLKLPTEDELFLELFEYHQPEGKAYVTRKKTNDLGGPRHIAVGVSNIEEAFEFIKKKPGIQLISDAPEYRPFTIDGITPDEFYFFDDAQNDNLTAKKAVCDTVGRIKYFYFMDRYGVQWEFEQKETFF